MNPVHIFPSACAALLLWFVPATQAQTAGLRIVSTTTYLSGPVAPDSLVAVLGDGLSASTAARDPGRPLPESLGGTSLAIIDSAQNKLPVHLLFASPGQINFLLPAETIPGMATLSVMSANGDTLSGQLTVARAAPGLYSLDGSGTGTAVNQVLRLHPDGSSGEGDDSGQLFLFLYGTGIRNAESVEVTGNGQKLAVLFAGPEGSSPGLDQVNVAVPQSLAGGQQLDLAIAADGGISNIVSVVIE
ncbi:MAG: hypothetical protein M3Z23_16195 [Acidobacteriota bacterium]|nr:hypothetical protein [Acidobacteriota bacterium]